MLNSKILKNKKVIKLAKKVKLFFYDTEHEDGVISISNQPKDYTGIGIEVNF